MALRSVYVFMAAMWLLMIAGGGIAVLVLGPLSLPGFGDAGPLVDSAVKAAAAVGMVAAWILVLSKVKDWVFHREISGYRQDSP